MHLTEFFPRYFQVFLLIWARMVGIVFVAPVLSSAEIPKRLRMALALMLAFMILPWAYRFKDAVGDSTGTFVLMVVNEAVIGIMIGFLVTLVFATFRLATQFFSIQMGLAMSQVFDPETQEQTPIMSYLFYMTSILVFLNLNGMQMTIKAVIESYQTVPVLNFNTAGAAAYEVVLRHFTVMFRVALKIALPVIAAGLIVVVSLGLIGKAAPQANILILGLPVQFVSGFIFILALLPFLIEIFSGSLNQVWRELHFLFMKIGQPV